MAGSLRIFRKSLDFSCALTIKTLSNGPLNHFVRHGSTTVASLTKSRVYRIAGLGGIIIGSVSLTWALKDKNHPVFADDGKRPEHPVSWKMEGVQEASKTGLHLTLYQYQSCPFCSKLRAFLSAYGFSYDVIEVNSVTQKQLKWSKYRKVPVLMVKQEGQPEEIQLNDSSVIISILRSYLEDPDITIDQLNQYYPPLESEKKGRFGKKLFEYPNKYFIMFGEKEVSKDTQKTLKEERKWRKWVDDVLVHTLSPNVYRTPSESIQTFKKFDIMGRWEEMFSTFERYTVIYTGSAVMWLVSKGLKKKHKLKADVRESLYDACNTWISAKGKKRKYMGGKKPNLADLNVYGTLSAIEGCDAWDDVLNNTNIGPWYFSVKKSVNSHCHGDTLPCLEPAVESTTAVDTETLVD